jgi:hypothetical protein
MGKGKRLKAERRTEGPKPVKARTPFSPGVLTVNEDEVWKLIELMDPDALPSFGLACFYLASSPVRVANQCLFANTVLMLAMQWYGIPANLVAVELVIPWANGGMGVRYGRPNPELTDSGLNGHIGLLTDERFIDATAWQFPEIRTTMDTTRPLIAKLGADRARLVAARGGVLQTQLERGEQVTYNVYPVGLADGVGSKFMEIQPDQTELPRLTQNLLNSYAVVVAMLRPGVQTRFPRFNAAIEQARGKKVVWEGEHLVVIPNED